MSIVKQILLATQKKNDHHLLNTRGLTVPSISLDVYVVECPMLQKNAFKPDLLAKELVAAGV